MVDEILQWLAAGETFWAYLVLAGAAFLEYVFPPFPGDAITLFGVFLTMTAGYYAPLVFIAITVGSIAGSFVAWGFGRWLGGKSHRERPRILRGPRATRALAAIARGFERHGAAYLVANRFLPALRAFMFVGAGISGIPAQKVLLFGGASAVLWNASLFGLGWAVGASWERLRELSASYSIAASVVVGVAVLFLLGRWLVLRARGTSGKGAPPDDVS